MTRKIFLAALVVTCALSIFAGVAEARGRYGSFRVGGYTSYGRGSHYVGGYVRSCRGWACR